MPWRPLRSTTEDDTFILEGAASTPLGLVSPGKSWLRHWYFPYLVDLMKKFNSVRNSQARVRGYLES